MRSNPTLWHHWAPQSSRGVPPRQNAAGRRVYAGESCRRTENGTDRQPRRHGKASRAAGFNLIEVVLAIFVMSLGLLSLFALFPTGLGMADTARQETQIGMFSEYVFSALRGRAAEAGDAWIGNVTQFRTTVQFSDPYIRLRTTADMDGDQTVRHWTNSPPQLARFPSHNEGTRHQTYVRYTLDLNLTNSGAIGTATLNVWAGRSGGNPAAFYTEFYPFKEIVQP